MSLSSKAKSSESSGESDAVSLLSASERSSPNNSAHVGSRGGGGGLRMASKYVSAYASVAGVDELARES